MKIRRIGLGFWLPFAVAAWISVPSTFSWGQKPPPPANPQAPTVNPLSPSGIQRGQALNLTITGTNLANPTGVSLGFSAKIAIPTQDKNGQDNAKTKVHLEISADMPIGWYPFRYATTKGISNLRLFCVDDLPQQIASGTHRAKTNPQAISVPGVVSGSLLAEQSDYYRITVKAGQRLSFDCLSRRLGSSADAQMYIYDAKSMRALAYDNDSPGCQTDPRISYAFKEAGDFLIEINDVLNRGGAEFFYRLRVGDFPLATTAMPLAAKRGTRAKIGFAGPAVEGVSPVEVDIPNDPSLEVVWVAPKSASGLHGWVVPVALSDHEEAVEQEPNDEPNKANRIAVPGGISGRFRDGDDTDYYIFTAKKGERLAVEARTLEYSSPSIVYMVLKNAKTGAEVSKSTPQTPPPGDQRIEFAAPDNLDYLLEVTHLYPVNSPSHTYHISVRPVAPTFELTLQSDRFDVSAGGAAAIPVQVARKGYNGPIELRTEGNASLSGSATVKAGQNAALLMVVAKSDVPMGPYSLRVFGKATVNGNTVAHVARARAPIVQALNGLPFPPVNLQSMVALAVTEKPPFSLAVKMDPPEGVPGGTAKITVTATRDAGFRDEIALNPPSGLPATIPVPKVGAIAKDKTEISFSLDLNAKTALGEYFMLVTARTKHQGKEFSGAAPPLLLTLGAPFDLKVETPEVSLSPGGKAKVKIAAVRKGGYKGPISVEIRKLPAGVMADKAIIAADQTAVEVEIAAAASAVPGQKTNVDVAGIATALNNLANASPSFTVRVQKK